MTPEEIIARAIYVGRFEDRDHREAKAVEWDIRSGTPFFEADYCVASARRRATFAADALRAAGYLAQDPAIPGAITRWTVEPDGTETIVIQRSKL